MGKFARLRVLGGTVVAVVVAVVVASEAKGVKKRFIILWLYHTVQIGLKRLHHHTIKSA